MNLKGTWKAWLRALRSLFYDLPRYVAGTLHPFRHRQEPTVPTLLLGSRMWISVERWHLPRLDVAIMDGHGEHYGYPRHHAYLLLWWNRRGYAWGVEYKVPKTAITA